MSKLPTLRPSLLDYLVEQKRGAARQARTSAFARSGTSVTAEGVTTVDGELDVTGALVVDGSETVNGPLAVTGVADISGTTHIGGALDVDATANFDGNTTIGGSLGVHGTAAFDGTTTIGGDLVVAGTLSLPNGIVGNDALASVVVPAECVDSLVGFALTTTPTVIRAKTLTVPAGITSAVVIATVTVYATNSTGVTDTLCTSFQVGSTTPAGLERGIAPAGTYTRTVSTSTRVLTGLTPGATFDVAITAYAFGGGWAYNVANTADIDGYVLWFR